MQSLLFYIAFASIQTKKQCSVNWNNSIPGATDDALKGVKSILNYAWTLTNF